MLPAQRREVLQQRIIHGLCMTPQRVDGPLQIHGVPQHDSRHHQVGVIGPVSLLLETAVANFPQPVEEHSAGQRVAGFAFVQPKHGVLCDPNSETTPKKLRALGWELRRQVSEPLKKGRALASAYVVHLGSRPDSPPIGCRRLLSKKRQ